jgi:hypothetical protein
MKREEEGKRGDVSCLLHDLEVVNVALLGLPNLSDHPLPLLELLRISILVEIEHDEESLFLSLSLSRAHSLAHTTWKDEEEEGALFHFKVHPSSHAQPLE